MIHPHTELRFLDEEIGYGVFATQPIPKGTITWARDIFDFEFRPDQVRQMDEMHISLISKFAYRNHLGHYILCWDFGRYVNHSFNANCFSTGYDFEIAIRDIAAGEELSDDYGYLNLEIPFHARDEGTTRKWVYPDDLVHFSPVWDAMVKDCLPLLLTVEQPLLPLIPSKDYMEILETIEGRRGMKSILSHYYRKAETVVSSSQHRHR